MEAVCFNSFYIFLIFSPSSAPSRTKPWKGGSSFAFPAQRTHGHRLCSPCKDGVQPSSPRPVALQPGETCSPVRFDIHATAGGLFSPITETTPLLDAFRIGACSRERAEKRYRSQMESYLVPKCKRRRVIQLLVCIYPYGGRTDRQADISFMFFNDITMPQLNAFLNLKCIDI